MDYQDIAAGLEDRGCKAVSADGLRSWISRARERKSRTYPRGSSAVLIPFLIRDGVCHVLYEVRAAKLRSQPGEICFPGGRIEEGETPLETAVREATEELCIDRTGIEIVGSLDDTIGPGAIPLFTYIGVLHDYAGTWSRAEVDRVFTVPLDWILTNDPEIYRIRLMREMPEDFPYEYVPGGRDYRWRDQYYSVPFYPQLPTGLSLFAAAGKQTADAAVFSGQGHSGDMGSDRDPGPEPENMDNTAFDDRSGVQLPVLWGVTARVTHALAILLREGRGELSR